MLFSHSVSSASISSVWGDSAGGITRIISARFQGIAHAELAAHPKPEWRPGGLPIRGKHEGTRCPDRGLRLPLISDSLYIGHMALALRQTGSIPSGCRTTRGALTLTFASSAHAAGFS